jgi:hypothetical protein
LKSLGSEQEITETHARWQDKQIAKFLSNRDFILNFLKEEVKAN